MSEEKSADLVAGIERKTILEIDLVSKQYSLSLLNESDPFCQALTMAEGIKKLNELLTPDIMTRIQWLAGKSLGFKTDEDNYPLAVIKDCFIEATLRGLRPIGNEWNIISKNVYTAQAGYERLVREFEGLTDLDLRVKLDNITPKSAETSFTASWNLNGSPHSLEGSIPVRVNAGSGADAVLGKARRKSLKAIYDKLTGSTHTLPPEGDVDDVHIINETGGTSSTQSKTDPLAAGKRSLSNKDNISDAEVVPPKVDQDTVGKIMDSFGGLGIEPELLEQYICCPLSELTEKDVEKFRELLRDINSGKVNCEEVFSRQKASS